MRFVRHMQSVLNQICLQNILLKFAKHEKYPLKHPLKHPLKPHPIDKGSQVYLA